jgi:hypothetical protein
MEIVTFPVCLYIKSFSTKVCKISIKHFTRQWIKKLFFRIFCTDFTHSFILKGATDICYKVFTRIGHFMKENNCEIHSEILK